MRRMGLEPTRPTGHKILSLACLPISAPPRDKKYISTMKMVWQAQIYFFDISVISLPPLVSAQKWRI